MSDEGNAISGETECFKYKTGINCIIRT